MLYQRYDVRHPFNDEWVGWQQNCYAAAAGADYTEIALFIMYTGNCNKAKFTNIFLHREAYGTSFGRDSEGKVLSVSNLANQKSDIKYDDADNIYIYTQPGRDSSNQDNQHWFYYGDTTTDRKKHLLWRSRTPMHMMDYYSYDDYGNATSSRRVNYKAYTDQVDESTYPYIRTETDYVNGNYTSRTRDARGNEVVQEVNANDGTLISVTDPNGQTVNYTYDASKRVTAVQTVDTKGTADTSDDVLYKNAYTYENDRIKTVSHNTTSGTPDVTYTFGYDELGRKTTVQVGTQTLSTNVYENDRNGLLSEVQYGNDGKVAYTYDEFDRLTGVKYDGETADRYTYEYGANGEAAEVTDNALGRTTRTDYDLADRPCQTELVDNATGEVLYKTGLKYNKLNNLTMFSEQVDGETHKSEYTYDRDNRVTQISFDGGTHKVGYTYDALGRVATRVAECGDDTGKVTSSYGYVSGGYGTNSTTPLVASISQNGINFTYEYDSRGNIISETRGNVEGGYLTTSYVYDVLGQLVRVNDPHENATWVYNYDRGGNITSKVRYAYTTGSLGTALENIPYGYGDSNWKDKLTRFNDRSFTYDDIGNPTNDGIWTYEWEAGRKLKAMSAEGTALTFKYDHNGLRTQKVVTKNGVTVTTNYVLHGKLITHMTVGSDKLHFFYDAENQPMYVNYNGTLYTYIHSLQRDIVGLLDSTGELVVEYKYDAWGRLLSTTGRLAETLGKQNPFRWRCNPYDDESELYYLRERYYSVALSRFINRDDAELDVSTGLLSSNPYAYCKNNPVKFLDTNGEFINMLAGAIAGGIVGAINAALSGDDILAGVAMGAATGAIAGAAVDLAVATGGIGGIAIAAVGGSIANTTNYIATEKINGRNIDGGVLAIEAATGALSNVFTFGLAGGTMKKAVGSVWNNMKTTWQKTIYARTTRKVAGRVVRKTSRAVVKRCVLNISSEVGISTVVATGALMHSKFYQRVMLAK